MNHLTSILTMIAVLGVGAQWLAWRFRFPAIVLLTLAGLVVGPILSLIHPSTDFGAALEPLVGVFVAIILFEGGMKLKLHELKISAAGVKRLVSVGVALSWIFGTISAHFVGGISWPIAFVFGAIIVVTGPTVILPLLRQSRLRRESVSYLKWEGIINDPIGALLAVLVFEYFVSSSGKHAVAFSYSLLGLGLGVLFSVVLGVGGGFLLGRIFSKGYVPEFLKAPATLALVIFVYTAANAAQDEAGLVAATLFGIVLGNQRLAGLDELERFKEYVSVILVSSIFILLTADLDSKTLLSLDWQSGALLFVLLFLVRPLSVWLATIGADMDWRDRLLVSWIAPRGIVAAAVAGVFAPRMSELGYKDAELLVPLVFALILLTVVFHGFSISWIAKRLKLAAEQNKRLIIVGANPWSIELAQILNEAEVPIRIVDRDWDRLRSARLVGLPVYFGEVLSESAEESLEWNDVGYLLAATDSDSYNALVCNRFATDIGRNNIYQLPLQTTDQDDPKGFSLEARGNIVFQESAWYGVLLRRLHRGWYFRKTRITEEYQSEQLHDDSPKEIMEILLVRKNGDLIFATHDSGLDASPGDVLISFLPPSPAMDSKHEPNKK